MNNREYRNRLLRQQARVTEMRIVSWTPEIAGVALLVIAVLASAGFIS